MPPSSRDKTVGRRCPNCGKPSALTFRPFCSSACRDRDLVKWLEGSYRIPVIDDEPDDPADRDDGERPRH